jgi:hypothetical protein
MTTKTLGYFDPGVNVAKRWNVAFEAAQQAMVVDPFILEIDGSFAFAEYVNLWTRMSVRGGDAAVSRFSWTTVGDAGIKIRGSAARTTIRGMYLGGPSPFVGGDAGLLVGGALSRFDDIIAENWSGFGLAFSGDVSVGTNANNCDVSAVTTVMCGHGGAKDGLPIKNQSGLDIGSGFYFAGGDANASTLLGCKAFDCRKGFLDAGFLGNVFIGSSGEGCTNKEDAGWTPQTSIGTSFQSVDPNCRATLIGCYAEADSPARMNAPAMIYGGMLDNIGTALQLRPDGVHGGFPASNLVDPSFVAKATLGSIQSGEALSLLVYNALTGQTIADKHALQFGQSAAGWWAMNYANATRVDAFRFQQGKFWAPNGIYLSRNGTPRGMWLHVVPSLQVALDNPSLFAIGDRVMIAEPLPGDPSEYVLTASGWKACGRVEA